MKRLLVMAGLLLVVPTLAFADGPETGLVQGTVTDDSGAPLPGVTVTLIGSQGEQSLRTETDGSYRFALIRPGTYRLKASLEGFISREASGVSVSAGGRSEVNFKLALGTSDEITVTSEAPMVDKFNVAVGGSVQAETAEEVAPVNRGIYGAIALLPGVSNDQESLDLSSSRPSFNGTPWQESSVFIDGVDTTFNRYGATRMFVPLAATTETNVVSNSATSEYGRSTGGITNVVVRSGTNNFKFEITGVYQNLKWDGNYEPHKEFEEHPTRPVPANFFTLTDKERDVDNLDYEASFGGPIKRDKAWFFLASSQYQTFTRDRLFDGTLIDNSTDTTSYIAKFNLQPSGNHSIAASWISTPIDRLFILDNEADQYVPTLFGIGGSLGTINWSWSINQNLFLETKLAKQTSYEDKKLSPCDCFDPEENFAIKQADPNFTPNPALGPHAPVNNFAVYLDTRTGTWNNGWLLDNGYGTNNYPRDQVNLGLTQFAGNHELRYGVDWQSTEWQQDVQRVPLYTTLSSFLPGNDPLPGVFDKNNPYGYEGGLFDNFEILRIVYSIPGLEKGNSTANSDNTGLYVRDRFSAGDHWTFNLGLRYESQVHKNDINRKVVDAQYVAPRLNAVYDVSGNGRMLFTASANRYYTQINQELINSNLLDGYNGFNANVTSVLCRPVWVFLNTFGCRSVGLGNFATLSVNPPNTMWPLVDAGVFDVDIEPYYRDEVVLGWEWQFSDTWATKVRLIAWETANQITAGQTQLGPGGELIQLTENVKDLPNILRSIGWVDTFVAQGLGTREQAEAALDSFDDAHRSYAGIQLELNRRYKGGWNWFNSLVLAESRGNTFGTSFNNTVNQYGSELHILVTQDDIDRCNLLNTTDRPADQQANCNSLIPLLGKPVTTANRYGDAERERPIVFKSYGSKTWTVGSHSFNIGGLYSYQDGVGWHLQQTSVTQTTANGDNVNATLFLEPYGTRTIGGYGYLNLSAAWDFPLSHNKNGELRLEVTNVTNGQELVGVDNTTGRPNQSKRSWSQPRKVRLTTTFRF